MRYLVEPRGYSELIKHVEDFADIMGRRADTLTLHAEERSVYCAACGRVGLRITEPRHCRRPETATVLLADFTGNWSAEVGTNQWRRKMNFEFWRKDRPEIDRSGDDNDSDLDETD